MSGKAGPRRKENIEILLQDKAAKVVLEYRDIMNVPSIQNDRKGILNRQQSEKRYIEIYNQQRRV